MYCRNCGSALAENAVVCSNCGTPVTPPPGNQPYQGQPYQQGFHNMSGQQPYYHPYSQQEDRPSAGFNALAFFFPLVGLILFLIWKDQKPLCAHAIGKWALIGVITGIVLTILFIVLSIFLFVMVPDPPIYDSYEYYDYGYNLAMKLAQLV